MKYIAQIDIMPLKELLDPQGKTVEHNLHNLEINGISNVRIGKHIELVVEAENHQAAEEMVEKTCKKLLANMIMESYQFELAEV